MTASDRRALRSALTTARAASYTFDANTSSAGVQDGQAHEYHARQLLETVRAMFNG